MGKPAPPSKDSDFFGLGEKPGQNYALKTLQVILNCSWPESLCPQLQRLMAKRTQGHRTRRADQRRQQQWFPRCKKIGSFQVCLNVKKMCQFVKVTRNQSKYNGGAWDFASSRRRLTTVAEFVWQRNAPEEDPNSANNSSQQMRKEV